MKRTMVSLKEAQSPVWNYAYLATMLMFSACAIDVGVVASPKHCESVKPCSYVINEVKFGIDERSTHFIELAKLCPPNNGTSYTSLNGYYLLRIDPVNEILTAVLDLEGFDMRPIQPTGTLSALFTIADFYEPNVIELSDGFMTGHPVGTTVIILVKMESENTLRNRNVSRIALWIGNTLTGGMASALQKILVDIFISGSNCELKCVTFIQKLWRSFNTTRNLLTFPTYSLGENSDDDYDDNSMSEMSYSLCAPTNIRPKQHQLFRQTPPSPGTSNDCEPTNRKPDFPYKFQGHPIKSDARKVLVNLITYYGNFGVPSSFPDNMRFKAVKAAGDSLNISPKTALRIWEAHKSGKKLVTPKNKKFRIGKVRKEITSFEADHIRRIVEQFYAANKGPTFRMIYNEFFRLRPNFVCGTRTFRIILRNLNFRYKKINRRAMLVQRPDVIVLRSKYLRKLIPELEKPQHLQKRIVFIDETWIDTTARTGKGWQPRQLMNFKLAANYAFAKEGSPSSPRLIVLSAVSRNGIISASTEIYPVSKKKAHEDYHDNVDSDRFLIWFEKLMINLNGMPTMVIMDNAPYHSSSSAPLLKDRKIVLQEFLLKEYNRLQPGRFGENPVERIKSLKVVELKMYVRELKRKFGYYKIDAMVLPYSNITLIRQPPWNPDLNVIEYVWADVKRNVRNKNQNMAVQELISTTADELLKYPIELVTKHFGHVERLSREYYRQDNIFIDFPPISPILIDVGADVEEDDESEDEFENDPPTLLPASYYDDQDNGDEPNEDTDFPEMPNLEDGIDNGESALAQRLTYDMFMHQDEDIEVSPVLCEPRGHINQKRLFPDSPQCHDAKQPRVELPVD